MARQTKYPEHRIEVLILVHGAVVRHAPPPTVRNMAEEVGVGVATMHSYLRKLADEGLIQWKAKSHRSVHLTPLGFQLLSSLAAPQP